MISAPPVNNWEVDYGPLAGLGGLLSGNGNGFLTQLANAFNAAQGGDGKSGLIGLFMQGRKNRDDAKLAYDKDVGENIKNIDGLLSGVSQFRNDDGTYDTQKMLSNATMSGQLANYGLLNPTSDDIVNLVNKGNSYKQKYGDHTQLGYAKNHTWDEYQKQGYEAFNPNKDYGDTGQSTTPVAAQASDQSTTTASPIQTAANALLPTVSYTGTGSPSGQTWALADNGSNTANAMQTLAQNTQSNSDSLPTRNSTLSQQSQEEGQKATQEAVNKGMEAANKGPGLLGSVIKGAIIGAATGGSGLAGALNGAKDWGLGQLGGLGQLYSAYQGISNATKGGSNGSNTANTAGTTGSMGTAAPVGNWSQYSLTQPTGYTMGSYGSSFMRNNGYGGFL